MICGASMFKNEPLVLALIAPTTSSDSAGVVVGCEGAVVDGVDYEECDFGVGGGC